MLIFELVAFLKQVRHIVSTNFIFVWIPSKKWHYSILIIFVQITFNIICIESFIVVLRQNEMMLVNNIFKIKTINIEMKFWIILTHSYKDMEPFINYYLYACNLIPEIVIKKKSKFFKKFQILRENGGMSYIFKTMELFYATILWMLKK